MARRRWIVRLGASGLGVRGVLRVVETDAEIVVDAVGAMDAIGIVDRVRRCPSARRAR
jgi:hypothetical protein